jgi:tetratricopeptide (TPR) repeat protein
MSSLQPAEGAALLRALGILGTEAQLQAFAKKAEGHPLLLTLVAGFLRVQEESDPQISYLQKYGLADVPQVLTDEKLKGLHRGKIERWMLQVLEASFNHLSEKLQRLLLNLSVYRSPFNSAAARVQLPVFPSMPSDGRGEPYPTRIEQDLRQLCRCCLLQEERDENGGQLFQFQPFVLEYARQKAEDLTEAYQRAIEYCQQSLEIKQEIGDRSGQADSLHDLGNAYYTLGQYQRAIEYYQQSLEIRQEIGDRSRGADSLHNLGNVYDSLGQYQQAIEYYQQSLEIEQEIGDRSRGADSLHNLGYLYDSLGQYQRAIEYYQQSLEIKQEIGDRSGEAAALLGLGNVYYSLGQYQRAIEYYQQSLEIEQEIGDRSGEANSLRNLGNVYYFRERYQRAIEYYQQSLEIKQEIGDRSGEAAALLNLGNVYNCRGRYQQAIEYYQRVWSKPVGGE